MKTNMIKLVSYSLLVLLICTQGFAQEKITKSFQVKKGDNLQTKVLGDVLIETWNKDEMYIEIAGINKDDIEDLSIVQKDNTVYVSYDPSSGNSSANFKFKVPSQINLDIYTSGGDINCIGEITGNVIVKTSGGDVLVGNVNGNLKVNTSGGDISASNVKGDISLTTAGGDIKAGDIGGDGKITTAGGDIRIKNVNKNLTATTAGGDIYVENVGGELKASTSGGDIHIGNVNGQMSIATSGGDIRVGVVNGNGKMNTSGGDIELKGGKGEINANTSGGDIKIYNVTGSINAGTSGGDVYAELIPDGKNDSKLASSGGKITLLIPENVQVTIETTIKINGWSSNKDKYKVISDFKADNYYTDDSSKEIKGVYKLNGGGKLIKLSTTNSDIMIKKLNK